jgi:hypothetical protein
MFGSCCRYWSDPAVLGKLSAVMGDTFDPTAMAAAAGPAGEGEEEEGEQEEIEDVHSAASAGLKAFALLHVELKHGVVSNGCNVSLFGRNTCSISHLCNFIVVHCNVLCASPVACHSSAPMQLTHSTNDWL